MGEWSYTAYVRTDRIDVLRGIVESCVLIRAEKAAYPIGLIKNHRCPQWAERIRREEDRSRIAGS